MERMQQPVGWGPAERRGVEIDRVPLDGQEWGLIQIDGWYRRVDLGDFFQRDPEEGKTAPMVLAVRAKDLIPVAEAPRPTPTPGLREDIEDAIAKINGLLLTPLSGPQRQGLIALERILGSIQAATEKS